MIAIQPREAPPARPLKEASRGALVVVYLAPVGWPTPFPEQYRSRGYSVRTFTRRVKVDGRNIDLRLVVVRERA